MCNFYSMTWVAEAGRRRFSASHNGAAYFDPAPAIFPGYVAAVVRNPADGEREPVTMNWGFVLQQQTHGPRRATNVRDDKTLRARPGSVC